MTLIDLIIAVSGVLSIFMTQCIGVTPRKWACIIALVGQPFFLYETFSSEAWGMFIVSVAATFAWTRGLVNHWLLPLAAQYVHLLPGRAFFMGRVSEQLPISNKTEIKS